MTKPSPEQDEQPRPRRIGVNLTWLVPGVVGGSEEYSIRLLNGLGAIGTDGISLRLYGRPDLFDRYPELDDRFQAVAMPMIGGTRTTKAARVVMEQTWLARAAKNDSVVHHMGGVIPLRRRQSALVTIHDLQPLDMPENFSRAKRLWLHRMIPYSATSAELVLCPSRFTASRLQEKLGLSASKIRVVPHGHPPPDTSESDHDGSDHSENIEMVRRFAGVRFLLYPAIAYQHKRHRDLLLALAALPSDLSDVELVLTGRAGPETETLQALSADLGLGNRVHFLGRIPRTDLDWLYGNAAALVFPSEYEGFGNPCLEAMSRGCPAIVSDAGSLPDVVGDAAVVVPGGDNALWVKAIQQVLTTPDLAAELAAQGYKRAEQFSQTIASQSLLDVYREALGDPSPGDPSPGDPTT